MAVYRIHIPIWLERVWYSLTHVFCLDLECMRCGIRDCPHGEPLHYHHDGCPACDNTPADDGPRAA